MRGDFGVHFVFLGIHQAELTRLVHNGEERLFQRRAILLSRGVEGVR